MPTCEGISNFRYSEKMQQNCLALLSSRIHLSFCWIQKLGKKSKMKCLKHSKLGKHVDSAQLWLFSFRPPITFHCWLVKSGVCCFLAEISAVSTFIWLCRIDHSLVLNLLKFTGGSIHFDMWGFPKKVTTQQYPYSSPVTSNARFEENNWEQVTSW